MANILCIETATETCSVCFQKDQEIISVEESQKPFQHASEITLLIGKLVATSGMLLEDLDAVAVSSGPGSYTGLRVGASAAKGICFALDIPLLAINTLDALAYESIKRNPDIEWHIPMLDARRMEVYTKSLGSKIS